jgi:UDP-N-acetylglucosamine 1-carboxyvinyltransferase
MKKFVVRGGFRLNGDIYVSGMKNAALPIIFACILNKGKNILHNVPWVSDIMLSADILRALGAHVERAENDDMIIDTSNIVSQCAPYEYVSKMRASTYLIGAMLARFGEAMVGMPGGCDFGDRPIDQHVKGFEALGAKISFVDGSLRADACDGLVGGSIYLDAASVGATVNIMIASVFAKGTTIILNAACEPHIADLANFLNLCGADICGAGTNKIKIHGVSELHPCEYTISPDMIEAGTFMVAAATAGGCVNVRNIIPEHLETVTAKLAETGVGVEVFDDYITVTSNNRFRGVTIKTWPYPGFPTDMHPQFSAMLCYAEGISTISEGIWDGRFRYVSELQKMGAMIDVSGNSARIMGGLPLVGATVGGMDLRAGAALVIAALAAKGTSEITGVEYIERGYFELDKKLRGIGAEIYLVDDGE